MKLSPPSLVIFDCDGVLIDSEIISATTLLGLLAPIGVEIDIAYVQEHFLGRSFPTVAAAIRKDFDVALPNDFERAYRRQLLCAFEDNLRVTEGLHAVLEGLTVSACVATSSSPERVARSLEIVGLHDHFADHVYTASEVAHGKPAPDLFLHVSAREAVLPRDCLVIEDSVPGLLAAQAANMSVLHYMGGSHLKHLQQEPVAKDMSIPTLDSWAELFDMVPSLRSDNRGRQP